MQVLDINISRNFHDSVNKDNQCYYDSAFKNIKILVKMHIISRVLKYDFDAEMLVKNVKLI